MITSGHCEESWILCMYIQQSGEDHLPLACGAGTSACTGRTMNASPVCMKSKNELHATCRVQAALAIAMVCFGLDFVSLFFGLSIFMMKVR